MTYALEDAFASIDPAVLSFEHGRSLDGTTADKWAFYARVQRVLMSARPYVSPGAQISKSAEIVGPVVVEEGARVLPGAFIEGPAYLGRGVLVGNCTLVRPGSFLSRKVVLGNHCYCTAAVLGPTAGAFHFCGVSRSLLEKNSRLSAFVVTASTRPDLRPVAEDASYSKLLKRGCLIGQNTFVGAHTVLMPAVVVGSDCLIGAYCEIRKDVPSRTRILRPCTLDMQQNTTVVAEHPKSPSVEFERRKQ